MDNYEAIKKVTGLGKQEVDEIMVGIRENLNKLESCKCHDFSIDATPHKPIGKRWTCSKCGGTVDSINKQWYETGLKHGRE